ncbi:MAG: ribosome maturation factor RimM [Ilumatobacteraceae bacterium]
MPHDEPSDGLVEIGRTGRAHGVNGEIALLLITDRTERVAVGSRMQVGRAWHTVAAARDASTRWLVRFEGVNDRTAAERLANQVVRAEPLDERGDAIYVDELIGAEVVETDGTARGRCIAVVDNPAHELMELDSGALVPVVFVTAVETVDGRTTVVVDVPDGLFELTEPD